MRGKAETCFYIISCICGVSVDYIDYVIRDVIFNGFYDFDIRREVLGIAGILEKSVNEVIVLVEIKEMVRNVFFLFSFLVVFFFVK